MAIKKFKPITPGQRGRSTLENEEVTRRAPSGP
jgi:ribosomal protein L2